MSFLEKPFFSVIIPTYNRSEVLKRALKSVLKQSFTDFEVLIIDDGSSDASLESTIPFKKHGLNLNYFYQKNQGVSSARNFGIAKSQADWICFLDSDDEWTEDKLKITYEAIKHNPLIKAFHTNEIWLRNQTKVSQNFQRSEGFIFKDCIQRCCIGPSTACLHKSLFLKVGVFREDFKVCEDYDFWLRVSAAYKFKLIPEELTLKYSGSDQLSTKYHSLDLYRCQALHYQLKNPLLCPSLKNLLTQKIIEKSKILLKGFKKHQNFQNQNLVLKILKDAHATT